MLIKIQNLHRKYNLKITGILHIGASECEELGDYLNIGVPKDKILWIEANPELCQKIRKDPSINVINATISDREEQRTLIIANNLQSSSILELEEHKKEHPHVWETSRISVTTTTIDKLLSQINFVFNFVNIDIQGAELLALKGMAGSLDKIDYLYLEVNTKYLYKDCALVSEIDQFLQSFGFVRVETAMTSHGWGDAFYTKLK